MIRDTQQNIIFLYFIMYGFLKYILMFVSRCVPAQSQYTQSQAITKHSFLETHHPLWLILSITCLKLCSQEIAMNHCQSQVPCDRVVQNRIKLVRNIKMPRPMYVHVQEVFKPLHLIYHLRSVLDQLLGSSLFRLGNFLILLGFNEC
jgi:hypothetical protein